MFCELLYCLKVLYKKVKLLYIFCFVYVDALVDEIQKCNVKTEQQM